MILMAMLAEAAKETQGMGALAFAVMIAVLLFAMNAND
jgi:hypothetical protein